MLREILVLVYATNQTIRTKIQQRHLGDIITQYNKRHSQFSNNIASLVACQSNRLPALGVGSFHARRAIPLSSNMGSNYSAKTIGVRPLYSLKTESEPSETKKHTPSRQVVTDDVVMWLKEHGSAVALSTAVISASALALPAISNAAPAVAELSGSGGLSSSASVFLEWLSGTGFYQAFSLVFLSEIGDKTFFIAGLLSMKTSRFISFVGSIGALAAMTVLSCLIGQVFHAVPSGLTQGLPLDDIAAVLAFAFFGVKTLMEALESDPSEGNSGMDEEFADAEEAVESSDAIKQATTL